MIKQKVLILFCCFTTYMIAQKEGNTWYFGDKLGLDFNPTNGPVTLSGSAMKALEGCASISDKQTGQLLFYTNGIRVIDKNNTTMPNSTDLGGHMSSTQSALIVPWPQSDSLYYIFATDAEAGIPYSTYGGAAYSLVNMSLNGGLGDVVFEKKVLFKPSCEKLTAVKHCNGKDVWVIMHKWQSDEFYVYLVTALGIDTIPVISHSGVAHGDSNLVAASALGTMKASPNGKKLAMAADGDRNSIELFDFDNSSGVVSNAIIDSLLLNPMNPRLEYIAPYGVSFSPNSQLLYASVASAVSYRDCTLILQYNLLAGSPEKIIQSKISIATSVFIATEVYPEKHTSLQLAPDNKIYVNRFRRDFLGVIESPDKLGAGMNGCNYNDSAINMGGQINTFGLPNFIESTFGEPQMVSLGYDVTVCNNNVTLNAGNGASYLWSTGATSQNISIVSSGTYSVLISSGSNCVAQNGVINVIINSLTQENVIKDTSICVFPLTLNASNGNSYLWFTGETTPSINVNSVGDYSVAIYTEETCLLKNELISVNQFTAPKVDAGKEQTLRLGVNTPLSASGGISYFWSPSGSLSSNSIANPVAQPTSTTTYTLLAIDSNGCKGTDTVTIYIDTTCSQLFVPNVFSPNGDEKNDVLFLHGNCIKELTFSIYDRWGNKVFESIKITDGWNGTYNVKALDPGVFVFNVNATLLTGETITKKGNVTLIR